jgi:hypothetical protein
MKKELNISYNLEDYRIPDTNTAYYVKDSISLEEEKALLNCIFNLD